MERASKCDLCSEDFISPSELDHHIAREHAKASSTPKKNFMCSMCDHAFGSTHNLSQHMRTHTGERPFKCTVDDCGRAFKLESTVKYHIQFKHSDERLFKCHFPGCRYAAKTSSDFNKHKKVHSDDRPVACSECDYKTNRNYDLQRHRIYHHSGRRDFKCSHPQCTKSFKTSLELKRHFSSQHEERKEKLSCSVEGCQYKGKNSRALERHKRLHKTSLPCPESGCSHYATTKAAFNSHLKLHNSSGRPFKCPLCSKYYPTLSRLQDHCFAHTNEKPFACGQCDYSASFRSDVKKHISSAHANVKFPFIVHLLDDRECLDCKVTLPTSEFLLHCEGHKDRVVPEP